jgi:hypothetical protein
LERTTQRSIDAAASPEHCTDEQVRADFRAALDWYAAQVAWVQMQDVPAYPPDMVDELETYYTDALLYTTREQIYPNQQIGRVVVARWERLQEIRGPLWDPDGLQAVLLVQVRGYELVQLDAGEAQPATFRSGTVETWRVALVYDLADGHWKIREADNLFGF